MSNLEEVKVGTIVSGTVTKVNPYTALVLLPNKKSGLVHISQVSHKFIKDINDAVKVDDVVMVKVLSIEEKTNRISLSIKDATEKPVQKKFANKKSSKDDVIPGSFEDKLSTWLKSSNETQTTLNKRIKRR